MASTHYVKQLVKLHIRTSEGPPNSEKQHCVSTQWAYSPTQLVKQQSATCHFANTLAEGGEATGDTGIATTCRLGNIGTQFARLRAFLGTSSKSRTLPIRGSRHSVRFNCRNSCSWRRGWTCALAGILLVPFLGQIHILVFISSCGAAPVFTTWLQTKKNVVTPLSIVRAQACPFYGSSGFETVNLHGRTLKGKPWGEGRV
jgi:hypothetical protein